MLKMPTKCYLVFIVSQTNKLNFLTNLDSTVKPKPILQLNGVTEYILYIGKNIV